jgi:carbon monoxide dehydrogenase subunit G
MPEVTYTTRLGLPITTVWDFVKDMNNWAPFLTGYQTHECLSDTDSIWTLKGDVGVLARTVKLKAHVTEWSGPERVTFTLTGLNEPVEGGGSLVMSRQAQSVVVQKRVGLFQRFLRAVFRLLFAWRHGKSQAPRGAVATSTEGAHLTFTLRMDAGGPTGPLVNAMLEPLMLPAAEDLANKIAVHLENAHVRTA